jgi:uncharacterized protein (DUF362 family)
MTIYIYKNKVSLNFIKIHSGDWVVIKPNFVKESKENDNKEWKSVITSPEIIELVCNDVCQKLKGNGKVTICDAPQTDSSFSKIAQKIGLYDISERCSRKYGIPVEILDLRNEEWTNQDGVIAERHMLSGDPNGSIAFDLKKNSLFYGYRGEGRYYGADYNSKIVNDHHKGEKQEYLICATPILADVFINLPKLKTHKKTGITVNLKNIVGINADKNWLPHHTDGTPENGGDQFPNVSMKNRLEQYSVKMARRLALNAPVFGTIIAAKMRKAGSIAFGDGSKVIRSGNWYGNDTTWRMVLDLNRCLLYGNPDGSLRENRPKRYYSIVDGIIGMEGNGPMQGDPVQTGVVLGGDDPVAVDMLAARVMGFDWKKIPLISETFKLKNLPISTADPEKIDVISDVPEWNGKYSEIKDSNFYNFKPPFGWVGHIEYSSS